MKVVVTGGAGFIGSHLVEALVKQGHMVTVIDNLSNGNKNNLSFVLKDVTFVKGNICDQLLLETEFDGAECVFHLAALHYIRQSVEMPLEFSDVNIQGTVNVLEASKKQSVKRVVFASSSAVYGKSDKVPLEESFHCFPINPYSISKYAGELFCKNYALTGKPETVSLRFFNVFGPRQDPASPYAAVIPRFIQSLLRYDPPTIFGSGEQSRDFVFVKDVVNALILASQSGASGKTINIGSGCSITINEVLAKISRILGTKTEPTHAPANKEEVFKTQASTTLAKSVLNFECSCSFDEGLRETIEWLKGREN